MSLAHDETFYKIECHIWLFVWCWWHFGHLSYRLKALKGYRFMVWDRKEKKRILLCYFYHVVWNVHVLSFLSSNLLPYIIMYERRNIEKETLIHIVFVFFFQLPFGTSSKLSPFKLNNLTFSCHSQAIVQ